MSVGCGEGVGREGERRWRRRGRVGGRGEKKGGGARAFSHSKTTLWGAGGGPVKFDEPNCFNRPFWIDIALLMYDIMNS